MNDEARQETVNEAREAARLSREALNEGVLEIAFAVAAQEIQVAVGLGIGAGQVEIAVPIKVRRRAGIRVSVISQEPLLGQL